MASEPTIRLMTDDDVAACEEVWHHSWEALRLAYALPGPPATAADRARLRRRMEHLRRTDPGGSWVADEDGAVVGVAQSLVRDGLWVLSLLGVAVSSQSRGVGRALMAGALGYGSTRDPGIILSSRDPRAMHRYVTAGFALLPSVAALGPVDHELLSQRRKAGPEIGAGGRDDMAAVNEVGRRLRGAPHGPDVEWLLDQGAQLFVAGDGPGFALADSGRCILLAATDEGTARALLFAVFDTAPDGVPAAAAWITAAQQWAIRACVELGLELHPAGGVMVRGAPGPMSPYLPSGAFG